jgi:hypothetical protein
MSRPAASSGAPLNLSAFAPQRKVLLAHSGGGGGVMQTTRTKPIRRTGPPGTHSQTKKGAVGDAGRLQALTMTREDDQGMESAIGGGNGGMQQSSHSSPNSAPRSVSNANLISGGAASGSQALTTTAVTAPGVSMKSSDEPLMSDKQSLCIELLVAGHVNSFVDFFYLTHRAEEEAASTAGTTGTTAGAGAGANAAANAAGGASVSSLHPPPIADSKLVGIQQHLSSAEQAHRRGDSEQVYESYEALAHDFHATQDYKTSIYFYEKCLDLAESMEDLAQQCNSNLNLGLTHDAMGDTAAAIRFHEKHKEIAQSMGAQTRLQTANGQLVEAYRRYAEEHERKDDNATAVLLYKRCLAAAQESNDLRSEGLATYRLGVACAAMGEKNESIEFQQKYLHICKRIGDQLGTTTREREDTAAVRQKQSKGMRRGQQ